MQIYRGADIIECEINSRPLYLPLLREGDNNLLLDCGTRSYAENQIPAYLANAGIDKEGLTWLIITHPDGDHCGGAAEIKRRYPSVIIACGDADRAMVESPHTLFMDRYDVYRREHEIYYDAVTAKEIRSCSSGEQQVTLTFVGGEHLQLGPDRILDIVHLPGHSYGHLGVYDRKHGVLYYGDAIQGAGYRSLDSSWTLCPTYLYVDLYLETIRKIESMGAQMIVGCHWPICRGTQAIQQFCAESRQFVVHADLLVTQYLREHPSGASLRELCEQLSPRLGQWPSAVQYELANAISGHLERGVANGYLATDLASRPLTYRINDAHKKSSSAVSGNVA